MLSSNRRERNAKGLGEAIRAAREGAGFTQKALANAVGLEYYSMISQMERGYVSVPPALWVPLADKLDLNSASFVIDALYQYQPDVYEALFGKRSRTESAKVLELYQKGQLDGLIERVDGHDNSEGALNGKNT